MIRLKYYTLSKEQIKSYGKKIKHNFPKYTTQILRIANQNSHGTRKETVGKMTDIFPVFLESGEPETVDSWRQWYIERYPGNKEKAVEKISDHIEKLKEAVELIDDEMISKWVDELLFLKTFTGLKYQYAILNFLARDQGKVYKMPTADEEGQGIDGYIDDIAYSVKSKTYNYIEQKHEEKIKNRVDVKMVFYSENDKGEIVIEVEE